jgi:hypothetical protein
VKQSNRQIEYGLAQVMANGMSRSGTLFLSTKTAVALLREHGKNELADEVAASGWSMVRIKDGVIDEATEDTWI